MTAVTENTPPVVKLRPAYGSDWPMIYGWLQQVDVQRWWGNLSAAEADVRAALQEPMGLCSMILVDGHPVGYAQAQDAGTLGANVPAALTTGTFRVDAFIGDKGHRGRGVGQAAVRLVAQEVFATTLMLGLIVVVSLKNEAAIRLYEKLGFRWQRVIDDPLFGPAWLMRLDRVHP
jgi:ribosomal protein S18 acetylase RimI-like enzyme